MKALNKYLLAVALATVLSVTDTEGASSSSTIDNNPVNTEKTTLEAKQELTLNEFGEDFATAIETLKKHGKDIDVLVVDMLSFIKYIDQKQPENFYPFHEFEDSLVENINGKILLMIEKPTNWREFIDSIREYLQQKGKEVQVVDKNRQPLTNYEYVHDDNEAYFPIDALYRDIYCKRCTNQGEKPLEKKDFCSQYGIKEGQIYVSRDDLDKKDFRLTYDEEEQLR